MASISIRKSYRMSREQCQNNRRCRVEIYPRVWTQGSTQRCFFNFLFSQKQNHKQRTLAVLKWQKDLRQVLVRWLRTVSSEQWVRSTHQSLRVDAIHCVKATSCPGCTNKATKDNKNFAWFTFEEKKVQSDQLAAIELKLKWGFLFFFLTVSHLRYCSHKSHLAVKHIILVYETSGWQELSDQSHVLEPKCTVCWNMQICYWVFSIYVTLNSVRKWCRQVHWSP